MILKRNILTNYLLLLGILQLLLYYTNAVTHNNALFYLDPRVGIYIVESIIYGERTSSYDGTTHLLSIFRLITPLLLISTSILMKNNNSTKIVSIYILLETLLAAPTALFILIALIANMNPSHGFSGGESVLLLPTFTLYTIIPLSYYLTVVIKLNKSNKT